MDIISSLTSSSPSPFAGTAGAFVEASNMRTQQIRAVTSMLQFNDMSTASTSLSDLTKQQESQQDIVWKVLIFDQFGQEIISPLLKVNELREQGVTVHMLLHSDREPIPDAPAIYFIEPTPENIARLSEDLAKRLYDSFYINFSSTLPRHLLEELAANSLNSGTSSLIAQVFDQYLNFLCPEKRLFSLNLPNSYLALNDPKTSETDIEGFVTKVTNALLSVLTTLEVIPFIRSARGNAAEMIARNLDSRLRDRILNSRSGDSYIENASSVHAQRPLLIILDRNMDLASMLQHNWSYQGLVHDAFDLKSNRISFMSEEKGRLVRKVYDVDLNDAFWERNAGVPFPQMTEDVDVELNKYKKETEEITRSCGVSSLEEIDITSSAKYLKNAITVLPKLTERKRIVDMHMNVASALLKDIKERSLDSFIVTEEAIAKQTKAQIIDLLRTAGNPVDKMRLFLLYYLTVQSEFSESDLSDFMKVLQESGCSSQLLKSIDYIKRVKQLSKMMAMTNIQTSSSSSFKGNDFLGKFSTISSKFADNLKDAGLSNTFDTFIGSIKNILPSSKNLPISSITESLIESNMGSSGALSSLTGSTSTPEDDYLFFNPKASKARVMKSGKVSYQEVIVFVVGGGNYLEYQNLQELARRLGGGKTITYGSTEILNASNFLEQLCKISPT